METNNSSVKRMNIVQWGMGSVFALVLSACATSSTGSVEAEEAASRRMAIAAQSKRETILQATWSGQPYDALLKAYGPPPLMMNVLGSRSPLKTSVVVFGVVDATANCVDSFTMVKHAQTGQWTVADSYCR